MDDLTIQYAVTGTATSGLDYTGLSSGSITILGGQDFAYLDLNIIDDSVIEALETVTVTLSNLPTLQMATLTIADNDGLGGDEPASDTGSISGKVWDDSTDPDGIREMGESGLSDRMVHLTTVGGDYLDSVLTSADGTYEFSNLTPGEYRIEFDDTAVDFSAEHQGGDSTRDSDANTVTFATVPLTVSAGLCTANIDAGVVPMAPDSGPVPELTLAYLPAFETRPLRGGLRVGKWENAFVAPQGNADPELKSEFIDLDPDRFYIHLTDARYAAGGSRNTPGPIRDFVDVKVTTSVDNGATVRLYETDFNSGVFTSVSLLAVSNNADDQYKVRRAAGEPPIADGALNDRTFKVKLGGTLSVRVERERTNIVEKVEARKVVDVNFTVMRKTPNLEARRENALAPDKYKDATRGYITKAQAIEYIDFANQQYASLGILLRLKDGGVKFAEQPANVNLDEDEGLAEGRFYPAGATRFTSVHPETVSLLKGTSTRTAALDDIEVYVVKRITGFDPAVNPAGNLTGWDETEDRYSGFAFPKGFVPLIGQVPDPTLVDSVVISSTEFDIYTFAHEIGHILTDRGHAGLLGANGTNYAVEVAKVNLMVSGVIALQVETYAAQSVLDPKRFVEAQKTMTATRADLLKTP